MSAEQKENIKIDLSVSSDKMSASIMLYYEKHRDLNADDVIQYLTLEKISFGILEENILDLFQNGRFGEQVLVAQGKPPVHGAEGKVDWDVDLSILDGKELIERGGRVDWKEQNYILQVDKDQCLAIIIPPEDGTPGKNIYGEVVPPQKGKAAKLPAGKNVYLNNTKDIMFAKVDGVLCRDGNKYSVSELIEVKGDVCYETGNIQYDGSVNIRGNVLSEFKVESGQDIYVDGIVEGACLEAGGIIVIKGGIQGHGKAVVTAKGDVTTKFIANANVIADGDVNVESNIVQSEVYAKQSINLTKSGAVISGGTVSAHNNIITGSIGTDIGVKTTVMLGADIKKSVDSIKDVEKKQHFIDSNIKKIEVAIEQIMQRKESHGLTPEQEAMRLSLVRNCLRLKKAVENSDKEKDQMAKQLELDKENLGCITVNDTVYPDTKIEIVDQKRLIQDESRHTTFRLWNDEIHEIPIS